MANDRLEEVCSNPPMPKENQKSVRCDLCSKPLVAENVFVKEGKRFCCVAAAAQYLSSNKTLEDFHGRDKKRKFVQAIKKVVILSILAAIAYGGYQYWSQNKDKVREAGQELREKAKDLENSVNERSDE